jgi:DNA-directed RNA polymerase subunit RPC12/RpoP
MTKRVTCNTCGHIFIVNPRPYTIHHVQCRQCNTYIGTIRTDVVGQWSSPDVYLHHEVEIIDDRGTINDYVVGSGTYNHALDVNDMLNAAERLAEISARNKARRMKQAVTGVTTKLTAQYCRHCGEEIPDMVEDGSWCSYCGGDIRR